MKRLPRAVKDAIQKARDSALLAVEVYNKPAVAFKSGGYVTLMVIAWTALFHAIFFHRGEKPYYRTDEQHPKGRYQKIDGDYRHWELGECLKQYYKNDAGNPVRKNLEFFIQLRNKIEHRSLPEIDPTIFGECQAMLLNFDSLVGSVFGARYCLRESLSFALQMYPSASNLADAVKQNRSAKATADFIERYRSSISAGALQSGQYAFKAFLIQVTNNESKDALPIQFFHYEKLTEDQKEGLEPLFVAVKYKQVPVANSDTIRAGEVVARVQEELGNPKITKGGKEVDKFNLSLHTRCWQHFAVRPDGKSLHPEQTDPKYCIYDKRHKDWGYTDGWVQLLTERLKEGSLWQQITAKAVVEESK